MHALNNSSNWLNVLKRAVWERSKKRGRRKLYVFEFELEKLVLIRVTSERRLPLTPLKNDPEPRPPHGARENRVLYTL